MNFWIWIFYESLNFFQLSYRLSLKVIYIYKIDKRINIEGLILFSVGFVNTIIVVKYWESFSQNFRKISISNIHLLDLKLP